MALLAKTADTAANYFNIFIALLLFLVMPVIITLAYKYNRRMDSAPVREPAEAETAEPQPAAAVTEDAPAKADADEED